MGTGIEGVVFFTRALHIMAEKTLEHTREKRSWIFLKTLDGYIFREFMIKFSILLLIWCLCIIVVYTTVLMVMMMW